MAFPATSVLTNFTQSDGPLDSNWTTPQWVGSAVVEVVSNQAVRNATFAYANAYWDTSTFGGSGVTDEVYATLANAPASDREVSLCIGSINPGTSSISGYFLVIQAGVWYIRRIDSEAETQLGATISQAVASGDGIGISRISGVIEVWHRVSGTWTSKGTRSDSTYTAAGYIGLGIQGNSTLANNGRWDDFGGGTVSGGTTFTQTVSGAMTPSGVLIKRPRKVFAGGITPSATLIKQARKSFTGGMTPSATLTKRQGKVFAGGITPAATLANRTGKITAGAITPAGTLTKQTRKAFTGGITPSGVAALIRTVLLALSGAITSAGTLTKRTAKAFVAGITPTGTLTKQTRKAFAGGITPTGALATIRTFLIALLGSITPSGTLARRTGKPLSGAMTPSAELARQTRKAFAGSITPSATLTALRTVLLVLSGAIATTGALTKRTALAFAGSIAPDGSLLRRIGKTLSGIIASIGTLAVMGGVPTPPVTPTEPTALRGGLGSRGGPNTGGRGSARTGLRRRR